MDRLRRETEARGSGSGDAEFQDARKRVDRQAARAEEELRRLATDSRKAVDALNRGFHAARTYRDEPIAAVALDRAG